MQQRILCQSILFAPIGQGRLLAPLIVAIRARGGHGVGGVENFVLVLGLRRRIGLHPGVAEALNELRPIRIIHGDRQTVGAFAARLQQQVGSFSEGERSVSTACQPP